MRTIQFTASNHETDATAALSAIRARRAAAIKADNRYLAERALVKARGYLAGADRCSALPMCRADYIADARYQIARARFLLSDPARPTARTSPLTPATSTTGAATMTAKAVTPRQFWLRYIGTMLAIQAGTLAALYLISRLYG